MALSRTNDSATYIRSWYLHILSLALRVYYYCANATKRTSGRQRNGRFDRHRKTWLKGNWHVWLGESTRGLCWQRRLASTCVAQWVFDTGWPRTKAIPLFCYSGEERCSIAHHWTRSGGRWRLSFLYSDENHLAPPPLYSVSTILRPSTKCSSLGYYLPYMRLLARSCSICEVCWRFTQFLYTRCFHCISSAAGSAAFFLIFFLQRPWPFVPAHIVGDGSAETQQCFL